MQHYENLNHLKSLFRELFQLDVADLDFGLYRLFRLKRMEIDAFLDKQLPDEVEKVFSSVADADRKNLQKQMEEMAKRVRDTIADDAILPSGEPNQAHAGTKAVKEYVEARKRLEAVETSEAQRAEVFNLLYAFFSRYYDNGDFISRRFFGARPAYAVPYNGEEVFFHWANKDQYYVKSGEAFRDYAFTVPTVGDEYRVRFRLAEATTPKDNTKGDTRYFFPKPDDVSFDDQTRTLTIPFEYRLPTEGEAAKYGKNAKGQEAILDETAPKILKAVKDNILGSVLVAPSPTGREADGEQPRSLLRRRLSHFTKKNTTDYFVHKNLGGFLRQELEFFIRDQVVHELDIEGDFDAKRRVLRVFRRLADTVITFLAQIEDAQKRLFEKKKFVLRTDWLILIQNIPRSLWKDVLTNKEQLDEWKALYALEPKSDLFNTKGKITEQVLEQNPTLVVDTRRFPPDFTARLLENIEDIDEQTDGLLIHSENFQALNLLLSRYRQQMSCIHIDPPYNTDASGFVYKNAYRHSSWLSMMMDRILASRDLVEADGTFICHIDENEYERLRLLLQQMFNYVGTAVWDKLNPMMGAQELAIQHEYILFCATDARAFMARPPNVRLILSMATSIIHRHEGVTERAKKEFNEWVRRATGLSGGERAYQYLDDDGRVYRLVAMTWPNPNPPPPEFFQPLVHPVTRRPCPVPSRGWSQSPRKMKELLAKGEIVFGPDETTQPQRKVYLSEYKALSSIIRDGSRGRKELEDLGLDFTYSHPVTLYVTLLDAGLGTESRDSQVLDFFAGSGTTGHAVINLNREDGGRRKFILVEVGDYFDTVLVPRIKKVMFTPEWKDGKPKRTATKEEAERTPRLVKVLRLESYEDALHNTFSDKAIERLAVREKAYREVVGDDEYRVCYLVKLPLEASDSMLNLAKLEHPFDYMLEVLTDFGPKTETVDLVETFNWLYGLRVQRMLTWTNSKDKSGKDKEGRMYRAVLGSDREGKKRVLVVWRDVTGLDPVADREFLESKAKELSPFEEQWVNGDTAAKGFASLDGLFKRLMGGEA